MVINYRILVPSLLFVFVSFTYLKTMLPSQGFHDYGEFQTILSTFDIAHPTGYPTFVLSGYLFVHLLPIGEMAWRANLLFVIYTALALVAGYMFVSRLTKETYWPLIGMGIMAFARPVWDHSGTADPHTLNLFLVFLLLYLFLKLAESWQANRWQVFCLIFAIGLGNHMLLLYTIPGFAIWFTVLLVQKKVKLSLRFFRSILVAILIGASLYAFLPLRQAAGNSLVDNQNLQTWSGLVHYVTGSDFHGLMFRGGVTTIFQNMYEGLLTTVNYFPSMGIVLAIAGILYGLYYYSVSSSVLLITFIAYLFFITNYPTGDPTKYYLVNVGLFATLMSIGAAGIGTFLQSLRQSLKLNAFLYYSLVVVCCIVSCFIPTKLWLDNYDSVDKSQDYSAVTYASDTFAQLPKDSVILSWWNYSTPLWYRQRVLRERPDIRIINASTHEWRAYVDWYSPQVPVFLIEPEESVATKYQIIHSGNIYRALPN